MNQDEVSEIRTQIRRCLVDDVEYGTRKDGQPLKKPKVSQGLFEESNEFGNHNIVDLDMVMEKVDLALYLYSNERPEPGLPAWKPFE